MRPVAVQVDYTDWLEIERVLRLLDGGHNSTNPARYSGILKLTEEPLEYQRRVRSDWG